MFSINSIPSNELVSRGGTPKVVLMFVTIFLSYLLIDWWVTADYNIRKGLLINIYLFLGRGGGLNECKVKNDVDRKVNSQSNTEQVEEIVNAQKSSELQKKHDNIYSTQQGFTEA